MADIVLILEIQYRICMSDTVLMYIQIKPTHPGSTKIKHFSEQISSYKYFSFV